MLYCNTPCWTRHQASNLQLLLLPSNTPPTSRLSRTLQTLKTGISWSDAARHVASPQNPEHATTDFTHRNFQQDMIHNCHPQIHKKTIKPNTLLTALHYTLPIFLTQQLLVLAVKHECWHVPYMLACQEWAFRSRSQYLTERPHATSHKPSDRLPLLLPGTQ